jgi:hypothetical protein
MNEYPSYWPTCDIDDEYPDYADEYEFLDNEWKYGIEGCFEEFLTEEEMEIK